MNAQEIVDDVRDKVQIYGKAGPLIDGFSTDPPVRDGTISVLKQINKTYVEMVTRTSFSRCVTQKALTIDTAAYRLDKVTSVLTAAMLTADGTEYLPIDLVTYEDIHKYYTLRNYDSAQPQKVWFDAQNFGVWPPPDDEYIMEFYGDTIPSPLVDPTDVPSRLDEALHETLSVGTAFRVCLMGAHIPPLAARLPYYRDMYKEWKDTVQDVALTRPLQGLDQEVQMENQYREPRGYR